MAHAGAAEFFLVFPLDENYVAPAQQPAQANQQTPHPENGTRHMSYPQPPQGYPAPA